MNRIHDFKGIVFDMDGVLIDSAEDIVDCLRGAYAAVNKYVALTIDKSYLGPPVPEMIKLITPDVSGEQVALINKEFRSCYDKSVLAKTEMRAGIEELLGKLANAGIRMFIATNKPMFPARRILDNLNVNCFCDIVTPGIVPGVRLGKTEMVSYLINKWSLPRDKTLMIGDSDSDIFAAHKNGLISLAVLDGYGNKKAIYDSKPDYLVDQVSDLYNFVTGLTKGGI